MLASKPECAVLQRYASLAATYMRELKLAIATLEGGVHRRVAPAAGSKLLWRGSWDISLHPQVTFLDTRSKRGSSADRRKKTAFTRSKRHFQISDCVAILIVAPSYFRTPEVGGTARFYLVTSEGGQGTPYNTLSECLQARAKATQTAICINR
jgi:hypothetical protein